MQLITKSSPNKKWAALAPTSTVKKELQRIRDAPSTEFSAIIFLCGAETAKVISIFALTPNHYLP